MLPKPSNDSLLEGWAATLWLVGAVTAGRLAYIAFLCPYALIEDEAHYWEWSRHLDWSYYSKGPGIAWAIAASTRVFGETEFGVRLPAAVFGAVAAVAVAGLTRDVTGSGRAAFYAVACFMLAPVFHAIALLMTIDTPYVAAWALAAWAGWRALSAGHDGAGARRPAARWAAVGLALGAGFLFKYTILLLAPGLFVFALLDRQRRGARLPLGPVLAGLGVAAIGLLPVLIWNAANGWPTVHHLLGHLGLASGDIPAKDLDAKGWHFEPRWTLEFIGIQLVILGPVLYLGLVGLVRGLRSGDDAIKRGMTYLACCCAPIVLFYLAITLMTQVEGNWALAGYVTLMPAAGWAAAVAVERKERSAGRSLWRWSVGLGLAVAILSLRLDWVAASLPIRWLERAARAMHLRDDRRLIPAGRLMAAPVLAQDAARLAKDLRETTGLEPFYIAEHYGRASLLAFYIPGHPAVYCSSSVTGEGRRTQYDYWADTDLGNLSVLGGRPAVCLGKDRERWEEAFERVEERGKLEHEPKKDRLVFLGFGYRGFGFRGPSEGRQGE